jgi:DNA phosphorothioation-dependent restriction protein DptG
MNRSLIVYKEKPRTFWSIRIHWHYGEKVENWIQNRDIKSLIKEGHRSNIEESYRELLNDWYEDDDIEPWKHKTLKEAINNCEHLTLAYFNGKQWKFTHNA